MSKLTPEDVKEIGHAFRSALSDLLRPADGARLGAPVTGPHGPDGPVADAAKNEGRYRYPEKYLGPGRSGPMIVARKYLAGDRALADRVIGLFRALAEDDRTKARALSEGTGEAGGFLVPDEFSTDVIVKAGNISPLANREFLRVIPMRRDVLKVPTVTTRPTVGRYPEGGPPPTITEPAFGEITLTANPFGALVPIGVDLLADASVDVLELVGDLFAEVIAEKRDSLLINGTGTNEPEGVRTASGVPTVGAVLTDTNTRQNSIIDTYHRIKPLYQTDAIWITSQKGLGVLMKIRDSNGQPVLQRLGDEPFNRLLGAPLFVSEAVPSNLGAGEDETELIFGSWKRFYIFGDRMQLEVDSDRSGKYFESRQVALRVTERYDGRVGQAEAFVRGTGWK
jgi:HK97 family phage major capsid protein